MKKVFFIGIIFLLLVVSVIFIKSEKEWFFRKDFLPLLSPKEVRVLFVGDIFFDRYIRKVIGREGVHYSLSCVGDFLKSFDFVVGNLEGPITNFPSVSLGSEIGSPNNFIFTFPVESAKILYENNIKIVNLGNNHINNFGKSGFESTLKYLKENDVKYFGGFYGDEPVLKKDVLGNKLSFVSFNEFGGKDAEEVAEKIKLEKEEGRVVFVYTHWGDEYVSPSQRVKNYAKLFAEAGADFVIGSHPHVILESEILRLSSGRETVVYYSLGNFLFDQYWNEEVKTGLALEIRIKGEEVKIVEHRTNLEKDGRVCLVY